jgi:hypothetical protein
VTKGCQRLVFGGGRAASGIFRRGHAVSVVAPGRKSTQA